MMAPSRRLMTSVALLLVAILLLAVWSLRSGAVTLDFTQVFNALLGSAPRNLSWWSPSGDCRAWRWRFWWARRSASAVRYSSR